MKGIPIKECSECSRELPLTVRLWGGKTYDGLTCKSCTDKLRQQSRVDANYHKDAIIQNRANYCCEICKLHCAHIMVMHHIIPVSEGGDGSPSNLIALCPNCHANIHYMQTYDGRDMGIVDDRHPLNKMVWELGQVNIFNRWLFEYVVSKTANWKNGEWYSEDTLIMALVEHENIDP